MSALLLGHELVTDQEGMLFFSPRNVPGRNLSAAFVFFVRFIGLLESSHVRELVVICFSQHSSSHVRFESCLFPCEGWFM